VVGRILDWFFYKEKAMRKLLVILGLVTFTMLASANDAFAQRGRGGRGGWGGGGVRVQRGRGYYGGGYYGGGYYGGRYYGRGYYSPYYFGYYDRPYYAPYYYSYDYSTPDYYYPDAPEIRRSFYSGPAEQSASVRVTVPTVDAQVWFDNAPTTQRGTQRTFHSPALQPGSNYTYTIKARWTENGQAVEQQRQVQVQPGQSVSVDFRGNSGETLPRPIQQK
jgi:uncharacterized protein (TIGR03000 family)